MIYSGMAYYMLCLFISIFVGFFNFSYDREGEGGERFAI